MGNHSCQYGEGSLYDERAEVSGASGKFSTSEKGLLQLPMMSKGHGLKIFEEAGSILNESCPYILIAIGRASHEQGVSLPLPAWGKDGFFEFPDGVQLSFLNRQVFVLRPMGYTESPSTALVAVRAEDFGIPEEGPYGLYLCSGPARAGDVTSHLEGDFPFVRIDKLLGHDLSLRPVASALIGAAASERCMSVLASLECRTWSSALFLPDSKGNPGKPLRDTDNVLGKQGLSPLERAKVDEANAVTLHCGQIVWMCASRGCGYIAESPVRRSGGTPDSIDGCEKHVIYLDHPAWRALTKCFGAETFVFDQCRTADDEHTAVTGPEKATVLMAGGPAIAFVRQEFGNLRCDHPFGTHHKGKLGGGNTKGSEVYSSEQCRKLAFCLRGASMLAGTDVFMGMAGVTQGKHLNRSCVNGRFLHRSFNHSVYRVIRCLPDALSDADQCWVDELRDDVPCDSCLRGDAPLLGPTGSLPKQHGLLFGDIWHVNQSALITGERIVLGTTHAADGFGKSVRLPAKSAAIDGIKLILAFYNTTSHPTTWLHFDNADELKGTAVVELCASRGIRITTTQVGRSRQNRQEPQWRVARKVICTDLCMAGGPGGCLPYEFWGPAWDHCEQGRYLTPSKDPPHTCPLGKLLGEKPKGAFRRPFGCLCYPTDAPRWPGGTLQNKIAPQSHYALCLGYVGDRGGAFEQLGIQHTQPGYLCYDVRTNTTRVTSDVRIVPDCIPGLQRTAGGGVADQPDGS